MSHRRLLLLNASNHPVRLAYPYAFVQVSEVGRRHAIETRRVDLFGVAPHARAPFLRRILREFGPTLIGITLRNTDSLLSTDYFRAPDSSALDQPNPRNLVERLTEGAPPYFPIDDTRALISLLRTMTEAPIIVGGFGFSTQPSALMRSLGADFGVVGDPEPVFARFDDVIRRRDLAQIDNLCFFEGDALHTNARVFHGPSPNREYDGQILADRERLFGAFTARLPATSRAVPVEVMRGCPYRCTFCAEPAVKGKAAQVRDLDVVVDELEFLRTHELSLVWFVCSEINALGNDFALQLAERVIRVNEQRPEAERVRWYTYYLLRFDREELRTLRRSGFLGGWNDIPAFDDKNLKQLRVPYRTRHLTRSIEDVIAIREEEAAATDSSGSLEAQIVFDPEHRKTLLPDDMLTSPMLTLFLGNPHASVETVRETMQVADEHGFAASFDGAFVIRAERVFRAAEIKAQDAVTFSYERGGGAPKVDFVRPTYRFSAELVEQLGSLAALERFFVYVEDTFLSRNHLFRQDWCWFLAQHSSVEAFHRLLVTAIASGVSLEQRTSLEAVRAVLRHVIVDPDESRTRVLFHPPAERLRVVSRAADLALRLVLEAHAGALAGVVELLDLPPAFASADHVAPHVLTTHLFQRFASDEELWSFVGGALRLESGHPAALALHAMLYRNNVQLRPEYRPFFLKRNAEDEASIDSAPKLGARVAL